VFAPVFRQFTIPALQGGQVTAEVFALAYADVLSAWCPGVFSSSGDDGMNAR
jgi:hypothetical protein